MAKSHHLLDAAGAIDAASKRLMLGWRGRLARQYREPAREALGRLLAERFGL